MSFSTYWQHINIHTQAYTHKHTPTLNTGSVIQSVKSDVCGGWLRGGGGRRGKTDGEAAKVSMTMKTAAMCTREVRKGSDTVKRSMSHCTSWTTGTAAPGSPVCTDVTTPSGWVEEQKWMTTTCPYCGPKKLVQFINKTTFFPPLTYKTIAAGRARGSPSSRKIKKKNKIK